MHYVCIIKIKISLEVTLASRKCRENKACGAKVCDIKKCGHITELMFDIIEQIYRIRRLTVLEMIVKMTEN